MKIFWNHMEKIIQEIKYILKRKKISPEGFIKEKVK